MASTAMFESFQPPYLPDNSSASSNASTQLEVISQNPVLENTDVVTHKSGANTRRSSQSTNILLSDNEDQHRGLSATREVTSIMTNTNFIPGTLTKNVDVGTGKLIHKPSKISDNRSNTPAIVISLLDSPTDSGDNEIPSVNDPTVENTITETTNTSKFTSSGTIIHNRLNAFVNQNSSTNLITEETSGDLDLSMVVENPTDYEPTILGTLNSIRRKPLRVMRCEHEELAILREVKKDNKNKGRKFFSCPRYETGEQCNYFRWEEAQYLPPRLPSHREDYVPTHQRVSRDTNPATLLSSDRPATASRSRSQTIPIPSHEVSVVIERLPNHKATTNQNQQEASVQQTKASNNDLLELTAEDMDPSWFLGVIEEEQARNASAKSKNNNNNRENDEHDNTDYFNKAIVNSRDTMGNISSSPDNSQVGVRNTTATDEPSLNSLPSSFESWSQVPTFTSKQLLDVVLNHIRTQEQYNVVYEENMEKMRKERDQALEDLRKAQEQIASLKRDLERSSLMTNILNSQKRLLEIEKEQLEDNSNPLKRNKSIF
ncbi:5501_t:CDS:1 [Acaulospora morrowiae]|uniref:5501_t:CDS:1 n=1 Tax=Acaulospora morrowiae TaxID=94023 RepID=A0A9N8ZP94_9GLOM|nr:5501_t:CDS:1 [Acaulospora morrowiae]